MYYCYLFILPKLTIKDNIMTKKVFTALLWLIIIGNASIAKATDVNTFCNPLNLDYRFGIGGSFREAADPVCIVFQDDYYIFASKSGGYWWSPDFREWTFVKPTGIDIEKYAPSVFIIGDTLYYTSSESGAIYKSTNPKGGAWTYINQPHEWNDPWAFVDDDGKAYCYFGSSWNGTINVVQLDPNDKFKAIGDAIPLINSNSENNGFEVHGDNNEDGWPWTEGPSMLKHNGKYYLLYATPGTEKRSYCDAYYVSDSPMGPFTFGDNSPVTKKSLGYVTGTGHGGLFYDKAGKLWTIVTVVISQKAFFERRLAVFPVEFDENGRLYANTVLGDYPQLLPGVSGDNHFYNNTLGWNLLSKGKAVTVSSTFNEQAAALALDEDIKTYYSAATGNAGEWFSVDLGKACTVNAIQSNFYESETTYDEGRKTAFSTKYKVEYSTDNAVWHTAIDKSASTDDTPHDYVQLAEPVTARYIKITNMGDIPGYGYFALNEFRVFGNGGGAAPIAVSVVNTARLFDQRCANIQWEEVPNADGYIIRYGIEPDKLWNNYQVWNDNSWAVRSLVAGQTYYFRIDAYNENGVTEGANIIEVKANAAADIFPLTLFGGFNPSIFGEGTFDENTLEITTGQYGFAGWQYGNGVDLSAYNYIVVELEKRQTCGASFNLFDENSYWAAACTNAIGDQTKFVIDLHNMTKEVDGNRVKCDPTHLYIVGFWSFGDSPIKLQRVFLSNDGETPASVKNISYNENSIVDVYSVMGIRVRSKVQLKDALSGLPAGIYIAGNRKVVVTNR
jgi:hypothetical protein